MAWARIIDEAVLGVVSAAIFAEDFTAQLTKDVNAALAVAARRPNGSTVKLEREITKRERQIARVNRNLEELEGDAAIKTVIRKVADMERELEALRAELVAKRRRNQSPPVTRVKEKDVLVELNRIRDVLLSDVGTAAPVLKALVGDVVIDARTVGGQSKPQMVARFTIDAVPLLIACVYWPRANDWGANGAIVMGAAIPILTMVLQIGFPETAAGTFARANNDLMGSVAFAAAA